MTTILLIYGTVCEIFSICRTIESVRSNEAAGGKLISTESTPRSSSGTKLFGVVFDSQIKAAIKRAIAESGIHFLPDKKPTDFLYLLVTAVKAVLKAV